LSTSESPRYEDEHGPEFPLNDGEHGYEVHYSGFRSATYYNAPDTSDRDPDESWTEYWDRKRVELHGLDCQCILCLRGDELRELGKTLLPPEMREWLD